MAGRGAWFYLGKLVWPANLIFIYPRWDFHGTSPLQYLWPIGILALIAVLWAIRARTRAPLAALLFFLGSLFPVCGFFNLYAFIYSYVADHWQYLPCIGIISLAALSWERTVESPATPGPSAKRPPPPPNHQLLITNYSFQRIVPLVVICALAILTYRQSGMYRDMETFYRRTIERNPACWMAENNLGDLFNNEGRLAEGADHFSRSLRIRPTAKTHYNLGTLLTRQRRLGEAVDEFQEALRLEPGFADARSNLAGVLGELGRTDEAIAQLEVVLSADPDSAGAHSNLGIALGRQGRNDEAVAQFREALRLNPADPEAHSNLGTILRRAGRYPEAVAELHRALELKPAFPVAHVNLGIALALTDHLDAAVAQFREAVRLDPSYAEAHNDLGNALGHQGRFEEARAEFLEALRLNPLFTDARQNLEDLPPAPR